jgi:hypothetical protein
MLRVAMLNHRRINEQRTLLSKISRVIKAITDIASDKNYIPDNEVIEKLNEETLNNV